MKDRALLLVLASSLAALGVSACFEKFGGTCGAGEPHSAPTDVTVSLGEYAAVTMGDSGAFADYSDGGFSDLGYYLPYSATSAFCRDKGNTSTFVGVDGGDITIECSYRYHCTD